MYFGCGLDVTYPRIIAELMLNEHLFWGVWLYTFWALSKNIEVMCLIMVQLISIIGEVYSSPNSQYFST